MSADRELPAGDRPGKQALLGPTSLGLGLVSWVVPWLGWVVAVAAVVCGVVSMTTKIEYRLDWMAVVGALAGGAQLLFSLMLFAMTASGY